MLLKFSIIFLTVFALSTGAVLAQENDEFSDPDSSENIKNYDRNFSMGFGINNLVKFNTFLNSEKRPEKFFSLNVTQRMALTENRFLRLGLNLDIHPYTDYKFYFSGYYIGLMQRHFLKRPYMQVFAGADLLVQQQFEYFDINKKTQNRFGVAPLAGIEWRVAPWLSFVSEFSYAFSVRQTLIQHETSAQTETLSNVVDLSGNANRLVSLNTFFHF